MVVLPAELLQFRREVGADTAENHEQVVQDRFGEHLATVLGHEDQMHVHQKYAMSPVSNIVVHTHSPRVSWPHATTASLQVRTLSER